jgi:hypothetical protein
MAGHVSLTNGRARSLYLYSFHATNLFFRGWTHTARFKAVALDDEVDVVLGCVRASGSVAQWLLLTQWSILLLLLQDDPD